MSDSPLDLAAGWFAHPRGLRNWPLYQSMNVGARMVVHVLLERARYRPGEIWFAGTRIPLAVGQLVDSEEEIARQCGHGVTRKVVRTAIARLVKGGFLDRRPVHPSGQCPHVITILNYRDLMPSQQEEGPRERQQTGNSRAGEGPMTGLQGAPLEQGEPGEPREPGKPGQPSSSASPAAPRPRAKAKSASTKNDPRHAPLCARLSAIFEEARGCGYGFNGGRDAKAVAALLAYAKGDLAEVEHRWRAALAETGYRRADSIHELVTKWNIYSAPAGAPAKGLAFAPAMPASAFVAGEVKL